MNRSPNEGFTATWKAAGEKMKGGHGENERISEREKNVGRGVDEEGKVFFQYWETLLRFITSYLRYTSILRASILHLNGSSNLVHVRAESNP